VRSAFAAPTAVIALSLLGGCATPTPGIPSAGGSPATSRPASHAAAHNTYGAPRVSTPLDTTRFQSAPCSVATAAQVQAISLTPDTGPIAPPPNACGWNLPHNAFGMGIGTVTAGFVLRPLDHGDPLGLAGVYRYYQRSDSVITRLPDIDGQPAVVVVPIRQCDVWVGLTDDLAYHVHVEIDDQTSTVDSCVSAKAFAAVAIATMKSGA
jgi:hypothetical protein